MAPVAGRNNTKRGNTNASANDKLYHVENAKSDISYMLYLYREELRKRKPSFMRRAYTKLQLTHELITKTVQNADKCSSDDLHPISRETIFKNKLKRQIARAKHYHVEKYQKQLRQQLKQHLSQQEQQKPQLQQQQKQSLPLQSKPNDSTESSSTKVDKIKRRFF